MTQNEPGQQVICLTCQPMQTILNSVCTALTQPMKSPLEPDACNEMAGFSKPLLTILFGYKSITAFVKLATFCNSLF